NNVAGRDRVKLSPGARPGGGAVDRPNVGSAWAQRREVDADAASPRHDLGHDLEIVQDAATAVVRARNHITVVIGDPMTGASSGEDTSARNELEVIERLVEAAGPVTTLLFGRLDLRD